MREVRRHFRPEFLNRLSDVVMFNPLRQKQLRRICQKQLDNVSARLADTLDVSLTFSQEAADWVIAEAYDPAYGARPLQRFVEKTVVTDLSYLVVQDRLPQHAEVDVVLRQEQHLDGNNGRKNDGSGDDDDFYGGSTSCRKRGRDSSRACCLGYEVTGTKKAKREVVGGGDGSYSYNDDGGETKMMDVVNEEQYG